MTFELGTRKNKEIARAKTPEAAMKASVAEVQRKARALQVMVKSWFYAKGMWQSDSECVP